MNEMDQLKGTTALCSSPAELVNHLVSFLKKHQIKEIVSTEFPLARELNLIELLKQQGISVSSVTNPSLPEIRAGLTGALAAVADSGTLILAHEPGWGLVSVLPPVHVAILRTTQICPTLDKAFAEVERAFNSQCKELLFITGPSRTSDLGPLVLGVHGPQQLHAVVLA